MAITPGAPPARVSCADVAPGLEGSRRGEIGARSSRGPMFHVKQTAPTIPHWQGRSRADGPLVKEATAEESGAVTDTYPTRSPRSARAPHDRGSQRDRVRSSVNKSSGGQEDDPRCCCGARSSPRQVFTVAEHPVEPMPRSARETSLGDEESVASMPLAGHQESWADAHPAPRAGAHARYERGVAHMNPTGVTSRKRARPPGVAERVIGAHCTRGVLRGSPFAPPRQLVSDLLLVCDARLFRRSPGCMTSSCAAR